MIIVVLDTVLTMTKEWKVNVTLVLLELNMAVLTVIKTIKYVRLVLWDLDSVRKTLTPQCVSHVKLITPVVKLIILGNLVDVIQDLVKLVGRINVNNVVHFVLNVLQTSMSVNHVNPTIRFKVV